MESSIAERTPDLIHDNICSSSQSSRTITTTGAAISGRNIDTPANMQLNSPPDSSPSHSPSPSIDTVIETPSAFSPVASALLAPIPAAKSRVSMVFDSKVHLHPKGSLTPRPVSSRSSYSEPNIADDECRQQSRSEPPPSFFNVAEVLAKRRAVRSPLRQRAQTQGQGRERPYSMMVFPTHSSQAQKSFCLEDALPSRPLELQSSNEDRFPEQQPRTPDPFWDGSEDPEEPESNKRPKNELRGPAGRRARGSSLANRPKPPLRRRSTMSMIADLDLSGADNTAQECEEDGEGGSLSIDASGTVVRDEGENTTVQTPIKKMGARRIPLTDISSSSVVQISLGAKPLGPLMTRQPRKGSTRQRLMIVNPFPMSPSYWEEYANDTFMYLLEIEGRYDRYMYMDPNSESTCHRTTLILWLVEVCYRYLVYQPTTLHAAVNILDRYLSIHKMEQVPLSELQCVGMCALMIAAKLEEHTDNKCSIPDLCKLCDLYTPQEITSMELSMLVVLKFEILVASATGFSDYFKRAVPANPMLSELTDFLCDLSLISHEFLDFNASQIAASAMWIALCAIHDDWSEELAILTGYSRHDLTPCTVAFKELICSSAYTLEQLAPLGLKYPLEQTLATLTTVLQ